MARDEELPIIRSLHDFILWMNPKIAKFPRDQRFVLGSEWRDSFTRSWRTLIRAS